MGLKRERRGEQEMGDRRKERKGGRRNWGGSSGEKRSERMVPWEGSPAATGNWAPPLAPYLRQLDTVLGSTEALAEFIYFFLEKRTHFAEAGAHRPHQLLQDGCQERLHDLPTAFLCWLSHHC